jgi:hypothetical protein
MTTRRVVIMVVPACPRFGPNRASAGVPVRAVDGI